MNLWILLALGAGAVLPVQAALNARLGRELGNPLLGALGSFVAGCIVLLLYLLAARTAFPSPSVIAKIPPYLWIGGVLGGIYVTLVILLTPRLGVASTIGFAVAGQIAVSVVLDHFGLFGLDKHPLNLGRIAGAILLAVGVAMVKRF